MHFVVLLLLVFVCLVVACHEKLKLKMVPRQDLLPLSSPTDYVDVLQFIYQR